jgi:hypothetical protein
LLNVVKNHKPRMTQINELIAARLDPDGSRFWSRLSLTPGFSPVTRGANDISRFNGLPQGVKAAEAALHTLMPQTPG